MADVKVLNIEPLKTKEKLVMVIDDVRYERAEPTLGDVIDSVEDLERLADDTLKMSEQMKIMIRVVLRAFPTLTEEVLRKQPNDVIDQIFQVARGDTEVEVEDAEGNAQPAS